MVLCSIDNWEVVFGYLLIVALLIYCKLVFLKKAAT
jgi:hypothetical protein